MNNKIWHSFGHAVLVFLYVTLVASVMSNGSRWFGQKDTFLTPIAVILLFVVSATIVGTLVLGRPIIMYLDNQRKEALKFLGYTVGWLSLIMLVTFAIMVFMK